MKKTIYDIANELGVAPSTVSKAISGSPGVSDKMRKKVMNYIKEVRYFPNANASKLKTKKTYTIGVLFSEDLNIGLEHSFFSSIIQAFKTYVEAKGYEITFVIKNIGKLEMSYLEHCQQKNIEGVFIVTSTENDLDLKEIIDSDIHCVSTDMIMKNLVSVLSDNAQGAKLAVQYFADHGFKHIGHLAGPEYSYAANQRIVSFKEEMKVHGLTINPGYIHRTKHYSFEEGYKAASHFIQLDPIPQAIFAVSDLVAMGLMKGLFEHGYKVPKDMKIIGFDDVSYSKYYNPALTTIRQDTKQIGEKAAELLLSMMDGSQDITEQVYRIPVSLIKRETT